MADVTSTIDTYRIDNRLFQSTIWEGLSQASEGLFQASRGAFSISSEGSAMGDYERDAFFRQLAAPTRRDDTSNAAVDSVAVTRDENIDVKVKRKHGPFQVTLDAIAGIGLSNAEFNVNFAQQTSARIVEDMLNTSLIAAQAAIANQSTLYYDATGQSPATLQPEYLNRAFWKRGDRSMDIVCIVGHSTPINNYSDSLILTKVDGLTTAQVAENSTATFGKALLVTDSSGLVNTTPTPDEYWTLALVSGAIRIKQTGAVRAVISGASDGGLTGNENLYIEAQTEYEFTVGLQGFKWDITNGDRNPTDATIGTGSNWDTNVTTIAKQGPGAAAQTQ